MEGPAAPEVTHRRRSLSFVLFLLLGCAVYLPGQAVPEKFEVATYLTLWILFSGLIFILRRDQRFREYWRVCFSYSLGSLALLLMWLFEAWPLHRLALSPQSPQGMAVQKVTDALLCAIAIVIPLRLAKVDLSSVYWQKGRLKLGLVLGLSLFLLMTALGMWQASGLDISRDKVLSWTPWILLFVLANGFLEELLFRGIFLKNYEPFLGPKLSNLATALVFAIGHSWAHYTTDVIALLVLTFVFALIAGYVMQKTHALWASVLFHAGADTLIVIGMFAGVKT
jgi:uncharacterized protein